MEPPLFTPLFALEELKKARNPSTGFYHQGEQISLFSNFLLAYALTRTKSQEGVLMAKELFEKLYAFQTPSGLFPRFLHEYPAAFEGNESREIRRLLLRMKSELALLVSPDFIKKTEVVIERMPDSFQPKPLLFPTTTMIAEKWLRGEAIDGEHLLLWHEGLETYGGPAYQEFFDGGVPEITLWDLHRGRNGRGADLFARMQSTLLDPGYSPHGELPREGRYDQYGFCFGPTWSLSYIQKQEDHPRYHQRGFSFLRILEKGEKKIHSLTFEKGRVARFALVSKDPFVFELVLLPQFDEANRDHAFEISFFLDRESRLPARTFFSWQEPIEVLMGESHWQIRLELKEGEGDFCLHRLLAKRPSEKKEGVYCHELSLRTLRRSGLLRLHLHLERYA